MGLTLCETILYGLIFFFGAGIFFFLNVNLYRVFGKFSFATEIFGGIQALLCALWFEKYEVAITVFAFFCVLYVVTLMDISTMEIEDGCHIAILIIALTSLFTMPETGLVSRLIGAFCISVPFLLITFLVPGSFGGGDIKLMAACGLFLGWKLTLVSTFLAILLGSVYGIYLLAAKKADRKAHFAFGPFLCAGMEIGLLWGQKLIQ